LLVGGQQMPPQGARALVKALFRPVAGGPKVSAVLFERHPGETAIQLTNAGGETAADLRYVVEDAGGGLTRGSLGDLPAAAAVTAGVPAGVPVGEVRCVWMCVDSKRRLHVWSYDGRHRRVRRPRLATDDACLRLMYGNT
jgi:hypothetical protein